ncbi:MAG: cytidylate kinase family protein [bacterium]|nr:cytidylate kinase family protein [bacterium]MDT8366249.1 cytidylate kinase family protein [bacterium]
MAILTICRESGAGGEEIGKAVAEKLGYEYVAREVIFKEIGEHGDKWVKWGKEMDDHKPSMWERFDLSFAGFVALKESIMYQHALKNNVVLMGRGGNWMMSDFPHALRVRIMAPVEKRIEVIVNREGIDTETAREMIEEGDAERAAYLKAIYHKDWTKAKYYDIIFDTAKLSMDEVVRMLVDELEAKDKKFTPAVGEKLAQKALASKVKARIITGLNSFIPTLEVVHDGKQIVLKGTIHKAEEKVTILKIAKKTAAPTPVKDELHYRGA